MPIFEYRCTECEIEYEILHRTKERIDLIECPSCHSKKYHKKFSSFAAVKAGDTRSYPGCASGDCDIPSYSQCSSGMCGVN